MDNDTLATIIEGAAEHLSCEGDASFYADYSGRCMYGAKCVGIVHDVSDLRVAYAIVQASLNANLDAYDALDVLDTLARDARTDSMGRSTIIYFPDVEATDAQRTRANACGG